jgi:tetratricopeptide (TPR) repeat protein
MLRAFTSMDAGAIERSRQILDRFYVRNSNNAVFPVSMQIRYLSWIGLMDIRQGRLDSARAHMARINSLKPKVEMRNRDDCDVRVDELRGELLLAEDSVDAAIPVLRSISVPPPGDASTAGFTLYNVPFMHDALARACARKGDLHGAIKEYRKLLTIDSTDRDRRLIHPRYHLRLAHLLRQNGERQEATGEYRKFLHLWKDAEKDRPELKEARQGLQELGARP